MAHLDLLSRSLCGAAACQLTSIVPLAPLDRLLSTCFRYHSLVLDVSWVKVYKLDLSSAMFCIYSALLCDTYYERDERASRSWTIFSRRENRLSEPTWYARCHPIGSKGHGGDVCIHRPAVFRLNKSLSFRFFFGKSMLALVPLYRPFFHSHCCLFLPRDVFYSICVPWSYDVPTKGFSRSTMSFLRYIIFTYSWKFFVIYIYIYIYIRYYEIF